jgi:hypothetical protein
MPASAAGDNRFVIGLLPQSTHIAQRTFTSSWWPGLVAAERTGPPHWTARRSRASRSVVRHAPAPRPAPFAPLASRASRLIDPPRACARGLALARPWQSRCEPVSSRSAWPRRGITCVGAGKRAMEAAPAALHFIDSLAAQLQALGGCTPFNSSHDYCIWASCTFQTRRQHTGRLVWLHVRALWPRSGGRCHCLHAER